MTGRHADERAAIQFWNQELTNLMKRMPMWTQILRSALESTSEFFAIICL